MPLLRSCADAEKATLRSRSRSERFATSTQVSP